VAKLRYLEEGSLPLDSELLTEVIEDYNAHPYFTGLSYEEVLRRLTYPYFSTWFSHEGDIPAAYRLEGGLDGLSAITRCYLHRVAERT
jgi:hypothetical protein